MQLTTRLFISGFRGNVMKKHDLIFLLFFILLTFAPIPVFRVFREQIGYKNTENKAESDFPELNSQNFSTWPRRFEEYLSDTLPFKTQFIGRRTCENQK